MDDAKKINPIRQTDGDACALARKLADDARFAAIACIHPETSAPHVTRIALATTQFGDPLTLISQLSLHTKALEQDPRCSLLIGEPGSKGDPLTHPRLTLSTRAELIADKSTYRDHYLAQNPKAALYMDFADFTFVRFEVLTGDLNGGFGKAYQLNAADLRK